MKISRESLILATIGIIDLVTTLHWVGQHGAREGNPLFDYYLQHGWAAFAAMKLVLLAGPILLLEWARAHRPRFTVGASRFAIVAYLVMYGVGIARLNPQLLGSARAEEAVVRTADAPRGLAVIIGARPTATAPTQQSASAREAEEAWSAY